MASPAKLGLLLLSLLPAPAQLVVSVHAGLIDYSQGAVFVDTSRLRAGTALLQMQPGQTISTGRGRAEVLLAPGIMMRLGDDASARMKDTSLDDTQVAIEKGSTFIEIVELGKNQRLRVEVGDSEIEFKRTGVYRLDSSPARLQVYGGEAAVVRGSLPVAVKRGQAVDLSTIERSGFKPGSPDSLSSWSAQRSFTLFNTSSENRRTQTHWKYIGDGWLWNRNYQVKYRSNQARRDNAWVEQQLREPPSYIPRAEHE